MPRQKCVLVAVCVTRCVCVFVCAAQGSNSSGRSFGPHSSSKNMKRTWHINLELRRRRPNSTPKRKRKAAIHKNRPLETGRGEDSGAVWHGLYVAGIKTKSRQKQQKRLKRKKKKLLWPKRAHEPKHQQLKRK